jgi:acetyltransferase-like isoleucine patch superfamily enzyme
MPEADPPLHGDGTTDSKTDDLESRIRQLVEDRRLETREKWNRDLPYTDLLDDRWHRARTLGFGEESSIYASAYVYGTVQVGHHVWIGPFVLLDGTGGLTIGDHCTISAGVQIYSHDTIARTVRGGLGDPDLAPVQIGSRTYIGSQTVIAKGVTIGEGCVIGAGSFVNRDLPEASFAVGTPCRRIGSVSIDASGRVGLIRG